MNQSSKPYWLKGGLIGGVIGFILVLVLVYRINYCVGESCSYLIRLLSASMLYIVYFPMVTFGNTPSLVIAFSAIFQILIFAFFGSLIGLIIGKIKSKRG